MVKQSLGTGLTVTVAATTSSKPLPGFKIHVQNGSTAVDSQSYWLIASGFTGRGRSLWTITDGFGVHIPNAVLSILPFVRLHFVLADPVAESFSIFERATADTSCGCEQKKLHS